MGNDITAQILQAFSLDSYGKIKQCYLFAKNNKSELDMKLG